LSELALLLARLARQGRVLARLHTGTGRDPLVLLGAPAGWRTGQEVAAIEGAAVSLSARRRGALRLVA
jgi:hypothetical protein